MIRRSSRSFNSHQPDLINQRTDLVSLPLTPTETIYKPLIPSLLFSLLFSSLSFIIIIDLSPHLLSTNICHTANRQGRLSPGHQVLLSQPPPPTTSFTIARTTFHIFLQPPPQPTPFPIHSMPSGLKKDHPLVIIVLFPCRITLYLTRNTFRLLVNTVKLSRDIMSGIFDALFNALGRPEGERGPLNPKPNLSTTRNQQVSTSLIQLGGKEG